MGVLSAVLSCSRAWSMFFMPLVRKACERSSVTWSARFSAGWRTWVWEDSTAVTSVTNCGEGAGAVSRRWMFHVAAMICLRVLAT